MFGIKLQLRSFSIKRCYSFRPIASYRDARGEETHAHTHAHLFLVKWFVTLSEIACRLPGFQRGKDRIMIVGKSIGVFSPGNITSMFRAKAILERRPFGRRKNGQNAYECFACLLCVFFRVYMSFVLATHLNQVDMTDTQLRAVWPDPAFSGPRSAPVSGIPAISHSSI